MQYRVDPKSGNALSVLGFGCMRFPMDKEKAEALIVSAIQSGVNYFDTAYLYGNSEATLGNILEKNELRTKVYIATKLPQLKCKTYDDFDKIFAEQLKRLKTDYIDYYLIHNMNKASNWTRLCDLAIEQWIKEKQSAGQIRQIGFSFHGPQDEFMALIDEYEWDFCMIQYNYLNENYQAGRAGLHKAHERGLPVMIMEPLLGGKLATGLPPKAMHIFKDAAAERSAAAWALMWLYNQPEVTVVLSGMNASEQLEENLKVAAIAKSGMFSKEEAAVFEPVFEAIRESYKVPCTGCNYCMPCPHGVNIPGCFAAYNARYTMGLVTGMMQYITGTAAHNKEAHARASFCKQCKKCEKDCPQNIPIVKELTEVKKRMEPFWFNFALKVIQKIFG
ncbi:MAG: aldo/keto reductase [Oscillospiraceae bacterium]|nr:aldo/keto reductase [Oscillospiraceae bacterium]